MPTSAFCRSTSLPTRPTKITQLDAFADRFLAKCTLGQTISRYMVLVASEQKLLMMRPYQVYAVKAIVDCIHQNCGNGYIWHTTGSGKTLTSFKAATLLKDNPDIEKCLFVVDRKDLDRQTREEFNRFQEGCVEENTNTATLVRRLLSDDYADKVIVTTIQKLGLALDENSKRNKQQTKAGRATYKEQLAPLSDQRIVFIFDECHRSQFGDNHQAIKAFFPKAQLFGFTGTPIFEANASAKQFEGDEGQFRTTADLFQKQLHAYTITHAIEDANVLRFHVDYFKPEGPDPKNPPKPGEALAKKAIIEAILAKHDTATAGRRFNAVLATASINDAIEYHRLFDELQTGPASGRPRLCAAQHRLRVLTPGRGRCRCEADPGRPAPGKAGQPARPRRQKSRPQSHCGRLQRALRHQPHPERVRPVLPGRAKAHQRPAVAQRRLPGREKDRHHHRGGHAAHRL
jgi:type I restriction enzyme R subunit